MDNVIRLLADGVLLGLIGAGVCVVGVMLLRYSFSWLRKILPSAIMAGLSSLCAGKIMSLLYQPAVARPFLEKGVAPGAAYIDNPGFPSDHALLGMVIVCAVYFLTPYKKLSYILFALVIVMCVARVLALVHTPLDVAGGIVAGSIGAFWYMHSSSVYKKSFLR